jgi:hypothetical protein
MDIASHNELSNRQLKLRHVFFPDLYGFISEVVIAVMALIVLNATLLSDQLLVKNTSTSNPLEQWPQLVANILNSIGHYYIAQQILLFSMWAIIGALIYILVFRLLQMGMGVTHSVGLGLRYVRQDHQRGALRWLGSLHDFFLKLLIFFMGTSALIVGSVICFGIASQELNNGLAETFPANLEALVLSILAAIVSVRIIVFGITLLSPRFQRWYTS